jgi:hypothetical protein
MKHAPLAALLAATALLPACFVGIVVHDEGANVTVYESNGKRQCEPALITPQQSARRLTDSGIDVRASSCAVLTSIAYPAVCGAPSGELVLHDIDEHDLGDAERLGFTRVTTLRLATGEPGYTPIACTAPP